MITAHAPSGYLLGRIWPKARLVLPAALIGAVLPDLDLIWFYLIDDKQFHHHRYWVHAPAFWAIVAVFVLPAIAVWARAYLSAAIVFFVALLMHISLDTLAGDIMWHWPFSDRFTHFVTIQAVYDWWVWNFILHWVFALELAIWGAALWLWKRQ